MFAGTAVILPITLSWKMVLWFLALRMIHQKVGLSFLSLSHWGTEIC